LGLEKLTDWSQRRGEGREKSGQYPIVLLSYNIHVREKNVEKDTELSGLLYQSK